MPLECLKSLSKNQSVNKTRNGNPKDKFKMFYTEVFDVSRRQQREYISKPHRESHSTEFLSENLPELLNLLGSKIVENEKSKIQKIKPNSHKRIHDSHSCSHEISSQSKNKNKANPTLKREIPINKRDFIVKQIPLKKDLLEFSIDRSQCPMVVRIHKGHLNKPKNKQGPQKSHSQPLTHSHSCPPCIEEKFNVTSENKTSQYKKKQQKSRCRLLSHGYNISDLLNLSPRKSRVDTPKNNSDIFIDVNKSNKSNSKKILRSKNKLENSCTNDRKHSSATDNIKDIKKKYPSNKKSIKPHKISVKEKCNEHYKKSALIEQEGDINSTNRNSPDLRNDQHSYNAYSSLKKPREINSKMVNDDLDMGCIKDHSEDIAKQMKQTCLTGTAPMTQTNQTYLEKCYLQSHAEGEMSHNRQTNCYCQKCKKDQTQDKKQTYFTTCQVSSENPETIKSVNNTIYDRQECLKLEQLPTKKVIVPNNVVTLDASQSQFYRISEFLKNNTSKCSQTANSEQLNLSSSTLNNSLIIIDDPECIKYSGSKEDLHPNDYPCGKTRKVRSEEKHLNTYTDMNNYNQLSNKKPSGPFLNSSRYISPFSSLNKSYPTIPSELKNNNSQSSTYYICLKCHKSVCEIMDFAPYCSDCNLKIKLSQISNESTSTNAGSELNIGLVPSTKALTTIPESDISVSKRLVNVAIQTDCELEKDAQEHKQIIIKSDITENPNSPSHSLENIFKMYCSMASQFKKIQGISNSNAKELLTRNNNVDLQIDQNLIGGDFEREIQEKGLSSNLPEKNNIFLTQHKLSEPFSTTDHSMWPTCNSVEPNIHSYRTSIENNDLQKETLIPNENSPLEYQTKASVPVFVSPIFPEKEYYRITCNKQNLCLVTTSSKESLKIKSKSAMNKSLDYSQERMQKPSVINVQERADREPPDCSIQSEISSPKNDVKAVEGSYISYEKRNTFDKEITTVNTFTNSPKEETIIEKNNELNYYCKREECTLQDMDMLPNLSFSVMRDSSLSLDDNLKSSANMSSKENYKTDTRHTLPRGLKHQDLNCISPHQSLQFQNSTVHSEDCHMICNRTSINDQQEQGFINNNNNNEMFEERDTRNEGTNCWQNKSLNRRISEECLDRGESNNQFYKHLNISKLDLQFKRVGDPAEDIKRGMSTDHGAKSHTDSLKVSTKIIEKSEINKSVTRINENHDVLKLHSFSYIVFNISVPSKECNSPNIEERNTMQDSSEIGLVLMPEKAADAHDDALNDIILGSKFKTQISSSLLLRKGADTQEFNVFEFKTLSEQSKVVVDVGSNLETQNKVKDNLENKPLMYKAVSPTTEVNELNNKSDIRGKINYPAPVEKIFNSSLTDQNFEIIKNHGKISNKALKKKKTVNLIEKKTNTKKSRKERKKFMKINNIFMCSYMAKMSFFRFVGGLQRKVCSELRK